MTSSRSIIFLTFLSVAGLVSMSYGSTEKSSSLGPSAVTAPGSLRSIAGLDVEDSMPPDPGAPPDGEVPPPSGDPGAGQEPTPVPAPGPEPTPAPAQAPSPFPAIPPVPEPAPVPPGQPLTPVPTPPTLSGDLVAKINPDPVPYSGQPVTDTASCRDLKHTWYYDQIVYSNTGSHSYTITERENFFDGRFVSKISQTFYIGANGSFTFKSRWCSGYGVFHYAQTRFTGKDESGNKVVISGPVARLLAP